MASKRRIRRRSCQNKRRFDTKEQAGGVLGYLKRRGVMDRQTEIYPCKFCGGYHLGRVTYKAIRGRLKTKGVM